MNLGDDLRAGRFLKRRGLFLVEVGMGDKKALSFLPNPARLNRFLTPNKRVFLRKVEGKKRRTKYDLVLLMDGGRRAVLDSRIANELFQEAIEGNRLKEFKGYQIEKREVKVGKQRFDFLLERDGVKYLIEVKATCLPEKDRAIFPDAPSQRARRHLEQLIAMRRRGYRCSLVFIAQVEGIRSLKINRKIDPKFCGSLERATNKGVELFAYSCQFKGHEVRLSKRIGIEI